MGLYEGIIIGLLILTIIIDGWFFWFLIKQHKQTLTNTFLILHIIGVLGWALSILLLLRSGSEMMTAATFATALFLAMSKYYFALTFPDNQWPRGFWHYLAVIPGLIGMVVAFIPGAVFYDVQIIDGYFVRLENGPYAGLYSLAVTYFLLYPIFHLMYKRRRTTVHHIHEQLRFLIYGVSVFFVIGLVTNSILPVFFQIYNLNGLGPVFSVILTGFIIYIVNRHNFLELKLVVQLGLIYTSIFAFIVLLYSTVLTVSSNLFGVTTVVSQFTSSILVIIVGVLTVPHLDRFLRQKTDSWFFKDRYDYQIALQQLSESLQSSLELDTLLQTCEASLTDILRAEQVTVLSEKTNIERSEKEIVIPIKLKEKLIGAILLGPKKSGEPYTSEDKKLLGTFATQAATAMSRVFMYQEVKRRADELELKVIERTEALQAAQEKQRTMMLHISHNLQTPLAILQTKIENLKKTEVSSAIENLERSLDQTSQFITDLLKLARLESGYEDLNAAELPLSEFLTELSDEVSIIAEPNDVLVTTTIEPGITITTDAKRLREALQNILSNALKYIGEKSPKEITIALSQHLQGVEITISDTGIGIPPEDLETIFTDFNRGKNQTRASGTGLGLSITQEIITLLGGTIDLSSTVGTGTTFTITLPK